MTEDLIVELEAEEGQKFDETGEAIASYNRSIVFLSKGVVPGTKIRVKLEEIRADSRRRMMYRGKPAPIEYTERWKDLGNSRVALVTIATDWLFKESEEGIRDERDLAKREELRGTRVANKIVWGIDITATFVEKIEYSVFHFEQEIVKDGLLVWEKVSEREEQVAVTKLSVVEITLIGSNWEKNKLEVKIADEIEVRVKASFGGACHLEDVKWVSIPSWVRGQALAECSVCSCGRHRRKTDVSDGYGKCELCRTEEHCIRCGKQAKVTNLDGRLVCDDCKPYEEQENLVNRMVPQSKREDLSRLAKVLFAHEPVPQEAGEIVLRSMLDQINDQSRRDSVESKMKGYAFYYFADDTIYASKFSSSALQILQYLPFASSNQLVELVAWLAGYHKVADCERNNDFYFQTQVKGESMKSVLTETALQNLKVAEWEEIMSKSHREQLAKQGKIWLGVEVSVSTDSRTSTHVRAIRPDGSVLEPKSDRRSSYKSRIEAYVYGDLATDVLALKHTDDNYGYQLNEMWEVVLLPQKLTPEQKEAAKLFEEETRANFVGPHAGFDLTKVSRTVVSTEYSRDLQGERRETYNTMCGTLPIDTSEWDTRTGNKRVPNANENVFVVWAKKPVFDSDGLPQTSMAAAFKSAQDKKKGKK